MKIILAASQVAAIIGRNKYKPRDEILTEYSQKYAPTKFTELSREQKAQNILLQSETAQSIFMEAIIINTETSTQVQKVFTETCHQINLIPDLNESQKTDLITYTQDQLFRQHGVRSEDKTCEKIQTEKGTILKTDSSFYRLQVDQIGHNSYTIVGRIDRIEECPDGSKCLVEIKNRVNKFFRQIPDYEQIQIQVYLQLVSLTKARLVQQYDNKVRSHNLYRDEQRWVNEIVPGLQQFCQDLDQNIQ